MTDGAKAKKMYHTSSTSTLVTWLCILVPASIFLLTMRSGFELASEPRKFVAFAAWSFKIETSFAFHIGVITMLFGFLALILGLPIIADLGLSLLDQFQEDTTVLPKDLLAEYFIKMDDEAARAKKTIFKAVARILITAITMFMLLWAIHTGYRLTTEPRRESKYYFLTTAIGILSIIFGLTYFIIGLAVIGELALDLFTRLQLKVPKGGVGPQVVNTDAKCYV